MSDRFEDLGNGIIRDTQTGLEWQANYVGLMDWQEAVDYASELDLGDHTDWRLPTVEELVALIDYSRVNPASEFPGMSSDFFWSSSVLDDYPSPSRAWLAGFYYGYVLGNDKYYTNHVRCVRRGSEVSSGTVSREERIELLERVREVTNRFEYLENGIIRDTRTGLEWQADHANPMSWQEAMDYAENLNLGGHTDWKLPTVEELFTLVDFSKINPASEFPGMPSARLWSSSVHAYYTGHAWYVHFNDGYVISHVKYDTIHVRCVRRGPVGSRHFDSSARVAELDALRAEKARLRAKLSRVVDAIRHAANSPGGLCAEIEETAE